jgi:hypothetical protein
MEWLSKAKVIKISDLNQYRAINDAVVCKKSGKMAGSGQTRVEHEGDNCMRKNDVTIMKLVKLANSLRQEVYETEKLYPISSILTGLASGLDVGLTLFEQSLGSFDGLTIQKATEIREYFLSESSKYRTENIEVSIWYFSYATALEILFLRNDEG